MTDEATEPREVEGLPRLKLRHYIGFYCDYEKAAELCEEKEQVIAVLNVELDELEKEVEALRAEKDQAERAGSIAAKEAGRLLEAAQRFEEEAAQANEQVAALRADAMRYRWLRDGHDPGPNDPHTVTLDQSRDPVDVRLCFGDALDVAVDACVARDAGAVKP